VTATDTAGEVTLTVEVSGVRIALPQAVTVEAGELDPARSKASLSESSIVADGESTTVVTFTAKDSLGNPVRNLEPTLTDMSGEAPATFGDFTESGSGKYTATVTAGTLTGKIWEGEWAVIVEATGHRFELPQLVLKTGPADPASIKATLNKTSITANGQDVVTVEFIARDKFGNPVPDLGPELVIGDEPALTWSGFRFAGYYTGTLTATYESGEAVVGVKLDGTTHPAGTLTVSPWEPVITDVTANGYTFKNVSFPTTGFKGAEFTLSMPAGTGTAADYTWEANADWVSVSETGKVSFTDTGTTAGVTITGTGKSEDVHGKITYSFTVATWYVVPDVATSFGKNQAGADAVCTDAGYILPSVANLTAGSGVRQLASLFGEWGRLQNDVYPGSGFGPAAAGEKQAWSDYVYGKNGRAVNFVTGDTGTYELVDDWERLGAGVCLR